MTRLTVLNPRWLLRMVPGEPVLTQHALVLQGERILEALPQAEAQVRYADADHISLPDHVLMPGLINAHTHAAMSLMRGVADDLPLMSWLQQHIWPLEARWVDGPWVKAGAMLTVCESIRGGVTCLNDMYFYPEGLAEAALQAGMRASLGLTVIDFPTRYATDAADYLRKGLAVREHYAGASLLDWTLAPHAPYTVSDESFIKLREVRDRLGLRMHCHVHETQDEIQGSLQRHGMRPLARLHGLGLLDECFLAVHMVHLNDEEVSQVAQAGVHVVHNPSSNLKLASGVCPVPALLAAGTNVALGSDGAAANNRQDMFSEMRAAALLAKGLSGQAQAVAARQALEMATLHAARALGREADFGSLEAGKQADVIAVSLASPECQPVYQPEAQLVYAAGREHVSDVWVAGRALMRSRELLTLDVATLVADARDWAERMRADQN